MAYSIKENSVDFKIYEDNPCEFYIFEFTIESLLSDPALTFIYITTDASSDVANESYVYPNDDDIISFSENTIGQTINRTVQILRRRSKETPWNILIQAVGTDREVLKTLNLPFKWDLNGVDVIPSPTNVNTVSPIAVRSNDQNSNALSNNTLQFSSSINNEDFGSNTIVGLTPDDYTWYLRDNLGCKKQINFTVESSPNGRPPFIFVSNLNSVYFAKKNNLKTNNENQLSYQNKTQLNNKNWTNKYLTGERLRFQYQSSFNINKVFIIKNNGLEEISVTKLSQNQTTDIREGFVTNIVNGNNSSLTVSYPRGGNVYNDNGEVIGTNTLDGGLLSANFIGGFVTVEGLGTLQIIDIRPNPTRGTVMELNYSGLEPIVESRKITTEIQDLPYDYYEFVYEFISKGCYQIAICDSDNFDNDNPLNTIKFLSERIEIVNEIKENHTIEWHNDVNNQIAWSTGIKSKINIPYIMPETFEPEDENEIYSTDTRQALIESDSFENFVFHFDAMPLTIARQLNLLLNSSYVNIDGVNYIKKEASEIDPQFGSNLYVVNAKMSKVTNYNSNSNEGQDISGQPSTTVDPSKGILKLK